MHYKSIKELDNIRGKRILLRLDLNVPIVDGKVIDDFRITKAMDTIRHLADAGGKLVIISHRSVEDGSIEAVKDVLNKRGPTEFIPDFDIKSSTVQQSHDLKEGYSMLLENVRFNPGEKENNHDYAKKLSELGDIYVNDAFAVMHREHASVVSLPKLMECYAGFLVDKEIENLDKAHDPTHPFIFILGGAKSSTKLPLIKKFINIADLLFVGGALANDFYVKMGYEVGKSLVDDKSDVSEFVNHERILLPKDVVVQDRSVLKAKKMTKESIQSDAGPETIKEIERAIREAKFILWNGPLGNTDGGYKDGTEAVAKAIANSNAYSIIGGGDSIAAVHNLDNFEKFDFVSTGGGAMLHYLAHGHLPGIEALSN